MDSEADGVTIEELSRQSGVPVRTIRYYISQGMLPGASGRGAGARYGEEHLLRLRLIRRLAERHVPLTEIGERLRGLRLDDVRALLAEEEQHTERTQAAPSPRAYIAALLKDARSPRREPPEASEAFVADVPPPAQAPTVPASSEPLPQAIGREEVWRHVELAPGVELRIRTDAERSQRSLIKRLLEATAEHRRRSK